MNLPLWASGLLAKLPGGGGIFQPKAPSPAAAALADGSSAAVGGPPFWWWVAALASIEVGAAFGVAFLGSSSCLRFFTPPSSDGTSPAALCLTAITIISGLGLGYRAHDRRVVASVAIAQAQGPQQAAASVVGAAGTVNVESAKP